MKICLLRGNPWLKIEGLELHDKYAHLAPILLGIAHEFRNPMQGIMASVAVIRTRLEDDETIRPFLEMIQSDTARINDLINDMLELTRPIYPDTAQSITTILEDAIRNVDDERVQRSATITLTAGKDMPLIRADGQMLSRGFSALIRNAIQSRDAQVTTSVVAEHQPGELRVQIQDNGEGIDSENLSKIFEPFFSTRRKRAGLGLCIADRAIDAHHGRISVESTKGSGTKIVVTLPVLS